MRPVNLRPQERRRGYRAAVLFNLSTHAYRRLLALPDGVECIVSGIFLM
jgi:hypothetical protein